MFAVTIKYPEFHFVRLKNIDFFSFVEVDDIHCCLREVVLQIVGYNEGV